MQRTWTGLLALACAGALAACGGSSGGEGGDGASYAAEGSVGAPVEIVLGTTHAGQVNTGTSYYVLTGLTVGSDYRVRLEALGADADLALYTDATYQTLACTLPFARIANESCNQTNVQSTALHITINGRDTGGGTTFQLSGELDLRSSTQCTGSDEGAGDPIAVADPLRTGGGFQGRVGTGSSYYRLTAYGNRPHIVALTGLGAQVDLKVYADASFTPGTELCTPVTGDGTMQCQATPTGSFLYVRVDGTNSATCFQISGLAGEGAEGAPVPFVADKWALLMVDTDASYFRAAVQPSVPYPVQLLGRPDGMTLDVFTTADFTANPDCTIEVARGVGACEGPVTATEAWLHLRFSGGGAQGGLGTACVGNCS